MFKPLPVALFIIVLVAVIVGVDVLFFRESSHTWERLIANIGIVLVFIAFYMRFFS